MNPHAALPPRFLAALPPGTGPAVAAALGDDLLARWNEPHRHYHDARHLAAMLSIVDAHAGLADDANHVRLAVWFHDPDVYDEYASAVRREYHHVPDDRFRAGRARVLRTFLDRPTLYRALPTRAALTEQARSNIRRELGRLDGPMQNLCRPAMEGKPRRRARPD